jgi:predicted permease
MAVRRSLSGLAGKYNPSTRYYLTGRHFRTIRDQLASFEEVAALDTYSETGVDLAKDGTAQRLRTLHVTSGYFRALGSAALRGPGFELDDEVGARRVVLSDTLWRSRFDSDPSVIGTTVHLSAEPYEIVGIAAHGIEDPIVGEVDAWLPYDLVGNTGAENYSLTAIGRLRNGVTVEQAQAELGAVSQSMKERWPSARRSAVVGVPLHEDLVAGSRGPLHLLLLAAGLVLLVACVNVANLMLVRVVGRAHEFAIRTALGSGRLRLVRALLLESGLLATAGLLLGLALAWYGVRVLQAYGSHAIPRLDEVGFDPRVLAFAAVLTLGTSIACGIAPALMLAHVPPSQALGQQSRSSTGTRGQRRLRSGLAAAQLALALSLLVGVGVLLASFHRLRQVDLGFRVDGVLTLEVNLPTVRYDAERRPAFHEELCRRVELIPGVTAAGAISRLPATGSYHPWGTRIETGPFAGTSVNRSLGVNIQQRTVSGDFFRALEIDVLAGRPFDERDNAGAPARAVVSANFARQAFPGLPFDAVIGQRIAPLGQRREIIGVVGDVALDVYGAPTLVVYHAHRQFAGNRNWALSQIVATDLPPERILSAVRDVVAALDPELVLHRVAPMTEVVGRGIGRERFALVLMGAFASVSLTLAALGLYGVLAYVVGQRTQEIGIRIALGASATQVRRLVLRQAVVALGIGLTAGITGAAVLGRWLSSLVFQVSPWDPGIVLAAACVLTLVGFLSAWLPARRASRVEPRIAMTS